MPSIIATAHNFVKMQGAVRGSGRPYWKCSDKGCKERRDCHGVTIKRRVGLRKTA